MGNAALRDLAVIEPVTFDELKGDCIAIDAHNWLYRYLTITVRFTNSRVYTTDDGEEVANLIGILQGVAKLLEAQITPVFVFDGTPAELKTDEIERRRDRREELAQRRDEARERGDAVEAARLDSQSQRLTPTIQETSRELLDRLDITYIDAPAEGEAQAAHMARRGTVDSVGTEDYDALLFGAPITIRQLTSSGDPERMDLEATLTNLGLTREQLIDAAILIGTDYNDGITGYGPKTAVAAVKDHGTLWDVLAAEGLSITAADRIRDLFLDPNVSDTDVICRFPRPDMDAVTAYTTDDWGIDLESIERPLTRIEQATKQTGLDHFSG